MPNLDWKRFFAKTAENWGRDGGARIAAAISFYAVLSLAPLLVLSVAIAGRVLGQGDVRDRILAEARTDLGPGAAEFLGTLIERANQPAASVIASVVSALVALWAASNLFAQLADAIYAMWGVNPGGSPVKRLVVARLRALGMTLVFGALVLGWLLVDSWIAWLAAQQRAIPGAPLTGWIGSALYLFGVFCLSFRALPPGRIEWRDVLIPAAITAVGFTLAKNLLAIYFANANVGGVYGPAGALVIVLLWIYYTSQIYFFGVEMTYTYTHEFGSRRNTLANRPPQGAQ